jgi:hypothetical protein
MARPPIARRGTSILAVSVVGLVFLALMPVVGFGETDWRIGLSAVRITPEEPLPMCGYSPVISQGVLDDLYAKAMVLEDAAGSRGVLLTADLLFFRAPMAELIRGKIIERTGLRREQILLNASHTHAAAPSKKRGSAVTAKPWARKSPVY